MSRRRREKELRILVSGVLEAYADESGSLSPSSASASPPTIMRGSVLNLSLNQLIESEYTEEYSNESQPLWIQIENATPKELQRIGEHFGLHPLTIEGIQTRHTREKLEIFQNYLFLVFHALHGGVTNAGGASSPMPGAPQRHDSSSRLGSAHLVMPHTHRSVSTGSDDEQKSLLGEEQAQTLVNENSSLLSKIGGVARYYSGGITDLASVSSPKSTLSVPPTPIPRRHKSQLSISAAAGLQPNRSPSPQPSPKPERMPGPLAPMPTSAMGPDALTPESVYFTDGEDEDVTTDESEASEFDEAHSVRSSPPPMSPKTMVERSNRIRSEQLKPSPPPLSVQAIASLAHEHLQLRSSSIKVVVFPHLVLTFHQSGLDTVETVRQRLKRVYFNNVESTAWIIHALIDSITDSLLPVVNATAMEVDALEELIYVLSGNEHRDLLKRMGMTRRRLSFLRQRLWSKRDILMSLIGKDWQGWIQGVHAGVQIPYLRDVYDHVVTMLHKIESASDLLVALQNTYLANCQIDVAEASNDANVVMKTLTAVGSIILPLQLVASLWGMNCEVPFQVHLHSSFESLIPFLSIVLGMLIVTFIMSVYFKKSKLLE